MSSGIKSVGLSKLQLNSVKRPRDSSYAVDPPRSIKRRLDQLGSGTGVHCSTALFASPAAELLTDPIDTPSTLGVGTSTPPDNDIPVAFGGTPVNAKADADGADDFVLFQPKDHFKGLKPRTRRNRSPRNEEDSMPPPQPRLGLPGTQATVLAMPQSTPELDSDVADDGVEQTSPAPQLFHMFRPRTQRKWLVCIRHGESEYNHAAKYCKDWREPQIYDPPLTSLGVKQASQLREMMRAQVESRTGCKLETARWCMSPLSRCLETFLYSCPLFEAESGPDTQSEPSTSGLDGALTSANTALNLRRARRRPAFRPTGDMPPIDILGSISEHAQTCGDIGQAKAALMDQFPALRAPLSKLDKEQWWFSPEQNCAVTQRFGKPEPKDSLKRRIGKFCHWMDACEDKVVIAIGHSMFWKQLLNNRAPRADKATLKNCELHIIKW